MTYRDRRNAKAEKYREWADKREEKADDIAERNRPGMEARRIAQPMDGRTSRRVDRGMDRERENRNRVDEFRKRADNIEAAAKEAIYSDDPDAIERLEAKIRQSEKVRDEMKADNATYRKAHRSTLKAKSRFEANNALPYPSFRVTNLTSNINRLKKRLAQLKGQQ